MLQNFYLVLHRDEQAAPPTVDDRIPWPVVLLLATHSRKHRFLSGMPPRMKPYVQAVSSFARKVKWAWHFRHSEGTVYKKPLCKTAVKPYSGTPLGPEISAFCRNLE